MTSGLRLSGSKGGAEELSKMLLVLAILSTFVTAFMWFGISISDPTGTQAARDAANHVLLVGGGISALFWLTWWFGW